MAEFKLGRLKFVWKGTWTTGASYTKDDIVKVGGKTYVCLQGHVAHTNFYTDLSSSYWQQMSDGVTWRSQWLSTTYYNLNDVVRFGANAYICVDPHTSAADFNTDEAANKWERFVEGTQFEDTWSDATQYQNGDIVTYGGYSYVALKTNTNINPADNVQDAGITDKTWNLYSVGYRNAGTWDNATTYLTGDVVDNGGNIYVCLTDNAGNAPSSSPSYWLLLVPGQNHIGTWANYTNYYVNDIVTYGGNLYKAIADSNNETPSIAGSTYWELYLEGYKIIGQFTSGTTYKAGEVVQYGGNVFRALVDTSNTPANLVDWQLAAEGIKWNAGWTLGEVYKLNDAVKFGTTSYICIQEHTATNGADRPDNDATESYWNALAEGDVSNNFQVEGDLLYFGATATQNLGIGSAKNVLQVNSAGNAPEWTDTIELENITAHNNMYIAPNPANPNGALYIGDNAEDLTLDDSQFAGYVGLTNASAIAVNDQDDFVQFSLKNINNGTSASTDLIAYANNGDNDSGWIDMGITSSGFDASSGYGITDINDGYIFMSAPAGTTGPGNLVIATDANGTQNDIVFCTGGFDSTVNLDAEKMRIIGEARPGVQPGVHIEISTASTSPTTGALQVQGGVGIQGSIYLEGEIDAFGGAVYQGRKDNGDGTYLNARELTIDSDRAEVTVDLISYSTVTKNDTTVVITYTVDATNLASAVVGGFIEVMEGTWADTDNEAFFAYNEIMAHDTVNREITLYVHGLVGTGTVTIPSDLVAFYYGLDAYVGLTDASGVFTGQADSFVQFALKNHSDTQYASTDMIAYTSNGDNESGWIDMGITSENYNDDTYGVTGPADGYIFMSAPRQTTGRGNLYLSTSENGSQNDIVFSTGGFQAGTERMRVIGEDRVGKTAGVEIYVATQSTSPTTGALRVVGGMGLQGNMNIGGDINITGSITIGGAGSSLETETLAVSDPMIRMGLGNEQDSIDLGFYGTYSQIQSTLDGNIDDTVTDIDVVNAASFPASGVIIIGDEEISYTAKTANQLQNCTRGANNTTEAAHLSGAVVWVPYYSGLVRNESLGKKWYLFEDSNTTAPTTTIDDAAPLSTLVLSSLEASAGTAPTFGDYTAGDIITSGAIGIGGDVNALGTGYFGSGIEGTDVGVTTPASGTFTSASADTLTVNGWSSLVGVTETLDVKSGASGVTAHDLSTSSIFFHSSIGGNFTANFTNVPTTNSRTIAVTLVLQQGATPYLPTAVQIDGVAQTLKWAGGVQPTPVANKVELVVFTLIRSGGSWTVLGQLSSYG